MLKKETIIDRATIEFWEEKIIENKNFTFNSKQYIFSKDKKGTNIIVKNEGLSLNPKIDFIHARKEAGARKIIIEAKPIIKTLYTIIFVGALLFSSTFSFTKFAIILIILVLIILYNNRQIKAAIKEFKKGMLIAND